MGIGRREFLKIVAASLGGLVVDPLQAVVTTDDVYINKKLGILFRKPASWKFVNVADFGRLKDEQILGNGWNELKDEIFGCLGDPICIVTKYYEETPELKGVFSPTITLQVTPKEELEPYGHYGFEEAVAASHFTTSLILQDFTVVKRYEPYFICGVQFHEFDAEYLFEHVDIGEPLRVELKTLKAEHNGFHYDFNCHQSSAQNQTAEKEFEEFRKSIRLV